MAFIQDNIPKPNPLLNFALKSFTGGLNNRSEQLSVNQADGLQNMAFADDTLMEKRKGQEYFSDVEYADAVSFLGEFRPYSDPDVQIVATNSKLFADGVEVTTLFSDIDGINHQGNFIFADGEKLRTYGKFPQENSEEYVKIIGTPVASYVIMDIVNPPSDFTPLDSAHARGVTRYDYTNHKIWYEPCTLEIQDTYLGSNVLPENIKYLISHKGRVYASGDKEDNDNVFITRMNNPYYFPTSLPIQLPPNSDKIVGMIVYDDAVVVGRIDDIYTIRGNTNDPITGDEMFKLERMNSHCGFANNRSFNIAHNFLFFVGSDGNMYAVGTTRMDGRFLHTQIISLTLDLFKEPFFFTDADIRTATSYFHKDEWYVSINDITLVYSYKHRAWTYYTRLNARSFYKFGNDLVWGTSEGRLAKFAEDNYLDFGEPYEAYWESKNFDMDDPNMFKQFKEFFIVAHTYEEHNSDIRILFQVDYANVKDSVTIRNNISIWGKSKWGDRLINRNINDSIPFVVGRRGRTIKIRISNGYCVKDIVPTYADLEFYIGRIEGILLKTADTGDYYLYTNGAWVLMSQDDLNQRMKIYQLSGDYQMRGRR